jgi:hypothetical protein
MVAGESSCHCSECGEVCPGQFQGCSAVWERGPNQAEIFFRHPDPEVTPGISAVPTNGAPAENMTQRAGPTIVMPGTALATASESPSELRVVLRALRAEVEYLTRKIDQTWAERADSVDLERTATRLTEVADALPNRVAGSLAAILQSQHQAVMADVDRVISERVPDAAIAQMLAELPTRMAIQLVDVSNRFGRQLTELGDRIEELLVRDGAPGVNDRQTEDRNNAILAEINQLSRVVAGTVELLGERGQPG